MEKLETIFTFKKKSTDRKLYIDDELYVKYGIGMHKYIGFYKVIKEYKTIWKGYLCRITHDEWIELTEQGRIKYER